MAVQTDLADLRDQANAIDADPDGDPRMSYLLRWAVGEIERLRWERDVLALNFSQKESAVVILLGSLGEVLGIKLHGPRVATDIPLRLPAGAEPPGREAGGD